MEKKEKNKMEKDIWVVGHCNRKRGERASTLTNFPIYFMSTPLLALCHAINLISYRDTSSVHALSSFNSLHHASHLWHRVYSIVSITCSIVSIIDATPCMTLLCSIFPY